MITANLWATVRKSVIVLSVAIAALGVCVGSAEARADRLDRELRFDIPAQSLAAALVQLSKQAELQLVTSSIDLGTRQSEGISGQLSIRRALETLLDRTGLAYSLVGDNTVAIGLAGGHPNLLDNVAPGTATRMLSEVHALNGADTSDASSSAKKGWFDRFLLAQNSGDNSSASTEKESAASQGQDLPAPEETTKGIPEVLVEGSKVLNMDIQRTRDDPQPYVIFDRGLIERSGATDLNDFLKQHLPMNAVGQSNNQAGTGGLVGNTSQINLRGLGANQTLILIDGRRTAGAYVTGIPGQTDLNGIPLSAVERIEILPTTASGIYGGGATGGVVNIVMRRDYQGVESKLIYDNSFDTDSSIRRVEVAGGFALEGGRTNVMLAGSYADTNTLVTHDRDFIQRGRTAILNNAPAFFPSQSDPPLGAVTNIRSVSGAPLFGPGTSSITTVPLGYAGGGGIAPLQLNAGQFNLDLAGSAQNTGGGQGLSTGSTVKSLTTTIRREFTPRVHAFLEMNAADNEGRFPSSFAFSSFTIAAAAPNNPFGQAIRVTVPVAVADGEYSSSNESRRAAAGIILRLPHDWLAEADYTWGRFRWAFSGAPSLQGAGASVANGTLDVLRDTNAFPLDFSPFVAPLQATVAPFRSTLKDATVRVSGPAFSMPSGRATLSGLIEYRDEDFDQGQLFSNPVTITFPGRSQSVKSAYLEARLPLITSLELQLAARHDEYTVNGVTNLFTNPTTPIVHIKNRLRSTNPTLGLRFQPISDLALRASYGTGFLPPAANQLAPAAPRNSSGGADPRRGNQTAGPYERINGGNPELEPEDSESWSVGAVLTPRLAPGLRLSLDYTNIDKTGNISTIPGDVQGLLDNESLFPGRVIRGPNLPGDLPGWAGPITRVDMTLVNIARVRIEAYDLQLDYHREAAGFGAFDFFTLASWQPHFETQVSPTAPTVENVGITSSNPLKLKAIAGLTWTHNGWTLGWSTRYFHSYLVSTNATTILTQGNGGRIPSQTYHDLIGGYRFSSDSTWTDGLEIQAGVRNLFDERPPFDAGNALAYYSYLGDPRLASYYLTLKKAF